MLEKMKRTDIHVVAQGREISSDCLALAVRVKCPIYIDESVVDEAGISVKMVEERRGDIRQEESAAQGVEPVQAPGQAPGVPPLLPDAELASLKKQLETALEEENYEEAARLRDRIRELESS